MAAGTTVGEFVLNLVVDAGKGELTISGLVASMGELEIASVGEIAILFELAKAIGQLIDANIKHTESLYHVTEATGMSSKSLQEWMNAAKIILGSSDALGSIFVQLSQDLELGHHGKGFGGLEDLMLRLRDVHLNLMTLKSDQPEKILEAIKGSGIFQGWSEAEQKMFLTRAHLQDIQEMLNNRTVSPGLLEKDKHIIPLLSDRQIHDGVMLQRALNTLEARATAVKQTIALWFEGPVLAGLEKVLAKMEAIAAFIHSETKKEENPKQHAKDINTMLQSPDMVTRGIGEIIQALRSPEWKKDFIMNAITPPAQLMQVATAGVRAGPNVNQNFHVVINAGEHDAATMKQVIGEEFSRMQTEALSLWNRVGF